jgi:nitrogen-specific signal transduction histidine kinase/CheY-like chemotaxis protein
VTGLELPAIAAENPNWGDREFAESQQREAARLEALVTLAAAVANDFNNALAAISGSVELARLHLRTDAAAVEHELDVTLEATRRAARMVRRVFACAHPARPGFQAVDPGALLEDLAAVLRGDGDPGFTVITHCDHDTWRVRADPEQLTDVVQALVANAREAMPDGGTLTLTTARVSLLTPDGPGGPVRSRDFVRLDVADTGRGVPAELLPRIFEPFFTTRPGGQGAGLGLSMVYSLLRQHQGGITVESRPGEGTCFHLYVPREAETRSVSRPASPTDVSPCVGATVLVVDNEVDIRHPVRMALERLGCSVLEAGTGLEGLAIHGRESGRIDLVVLDVVMPGLSGWEVLAALKRRDPTLPVVLVSGALPVHVQQAASEARADASLAKPYGLVELANTVCGLLAGRRKSRANGPSPLLDRPR